MYEIKKERIKSGKMLLILMLLYKLIYKLSSYINKNIYIIAY